MGSPQALSETDRRTVAAWAADCAERALPLFEAEAPDDGRPRDGVARARAFSRGDLDTAGEIRRRFVAGRAAGGVTLPAAKAAAHAAGQASGVAHMGAHALGAAAYAAKAVSLAAPPSERAGALEREVAAQVALLTPQVRAALRQLPALGEDSAGPLGPGLLSSGVLAEVVRALQAEIGRGWSVSPADARGCDALVLDRRGQGGARTGGARAGGARSAARSVPSRISVPQTRGVPASPPSPGASPDPRPRRRRLVVAVAAAVAVVLVAAAALAFRELRQRGEDQVSVGGVPVAGPPSSSSPTGSAACDGSAGGDLRFDTEMTGADGESVPYSVSLPADYYTACRTYPVLYALHGRDQSNATFLPEAERLRAAVEAGALRDVVIVTPDSNKDGRWEGVYDTHFIDDLIPHVEKTYRVEPGAAQRLLVGWSMGGHGAFRFGVEHPVDFAAVWSVDGAMSRDPQSYLEFLPGVEADPPQIRLTGGDLNGDRVEAVVDLFAQQGVDFPYQREPLGHDFKLFVEADQKADWERVRWLDSQLGRQV